MKYHLLLTSLCIFIFVAPSVLSAQTVIENWVQTEGQSISSITSDNAGNIYAIENSFERITKYAPDGTVSRIWDFTGAGPYKMAFDLAGNGYTCNLKTNSISKIIPDGTLIQDWALLGSATRPQNIAVDASGNVYTTNYLIGTVSKVRPDGVVTVQWATVGKYPSDLLFDKSGNLYVANSGSNSISKIRPDGTVTTNWAMVGNSPVAMAIDATGNLYVANQGGLSISKITPQGDVTIKWADIADSPHTINIDSHGNIYTSNYSRSTISKITPDGNSQPSWLEFPGGAYQLPDMVIDPSGNLYISRAHLDIIKVIPQAFHPANDILYVNTAAAPGGDGSNWAQALTSFQEAVDAAISINDAATRSTDSALQIWVARGSYQPEFGHSFSMAPGVRIYGSFAGTESDPSERSFAPADTSILLGNGASVMRNDNNNLNSLAVLDGFKITGGTAMGTGNANYGGGIYNRGVSPTLSHLVITANSAEDVGGGILNDNSSSPIITNVIISNNSANIRGGGGMANFSTSNPILYNVLVVNNTAGNTTSGIGNGGGFYNSGSSPQLYNVTVSGNAAANNGGGLYNTNSYSLIINTIFWANNSLSDGANEIGNESGTVSAQWSLIRNRPNDTTGSVTASFHVLFDSPAFVDSTAGDYRLKPSSPAINGGLNSILPPSVSLDLDGNNRIFDKAADGIVDIGAYEFQGNAVLPVKLANFQGNVSNYTAKISWQSNSEINFNRYELEKSTDAVNYALIASISAAGSNNHYLKSVPQKEPKVYYRLKLIDNSGKYDYSKTILLKQGDQQDNALYPNPASDFIHIQASKGGQLFIYNAAGQLVVKHQIQHGLNKINIKGFSTGLYFAVINGQKYRFIKR